MGKRKKTHMVGFNLNSNKDYNDNHTSEASEQTSPTVQSVSYFKDNWKSPADCTEEGP